MSADTLTYISSLSLTDRKIYRDVRCQRRDDETRLSPAPNARWRQGGTVLWFECAPHGHAFEIEFGHHKGNVIVTSSVR